MSSVSTLSKRDRHLKRVELQISVECTYFTLHLMFASWMVTKLLLRNRSQCTGLYYFASRAVISPLYLVKYLAQLNMFQTRFCLCYSDVQCRPTAVFFSKPFMRKFAQFILCPVQLTRRIVANRNCFQRPSFIIQSGPKKCIHSLLINTFGINLNEISISG